MDYAVLRDGARIGTSPLPSYRDHGLANGTYVYTVVAVDAAGHESEESLSDDATIDVAPAPPAAPVILEPTDAAHPISLSWPLADVGGRAVAGNVVALEVNAQSRGSAPAEPGCSTRAGPPSGGRATSRSLLMDSAPPGLSTPPRCRCGVWPPAPSPPDSHGGDTHSRIHRFSPDGNALALVQRVFVSGAGYQPRVVRLDLVTREVEELVDGDAVDLAWSPDGSRLAVSLNEGGDTSVHLVDVETLARSEIHRSGGTDTHLRWSPEGARLAFVRTWSPLVAELRVVDLDSGSTELPDEQAWGGSAPGWSADGRLLAWTSVAEGQQTIRILDTGTGEEVPGVSGVAYDVRDPRFSPAGDWLSYARTPSSGEPWLENQVFVLHQGTGIHVPASTFGHAEVPGVHAWIDGELAVASQGWLDRHAPVAGRFVLPEVPLVVGENRLVARATDSDTGLSSEDSEVVLVTVPEDAFPNLLVAGLGVSPPVPLAGRAGNVRVRVENLGIEDAEETEVAMSTVDPDGRVGPEVRIEVPYLESGLSTEVLVPWTPALGGEHRVTVDVDPDGRVPEHDDGDNRAERSFMVAEEEALVAAIASDRSTYGAHRNARVSVTLANAGPPYRGVARTLVEDLDGVEVAVLDERGVELEYGRTATWDLEWSTGTSWAGSYRFRVVACPEGSDAASECVAAARPFTLEAEHRLAVALRPEPAIVASGGPVSFALGVDNQGANAALEGAVLRLQVRAGGGGPVLFESLQPLPSLLPGTSWEGLEVWATAQPAGSHAVSLTVEKPEGTALAGVTTVLLVEPGVARVVGTLEVDPGHVLRGQAAEARAVLTNAGTLPAVGFPIAVELLTGPEPTVHASVPASVDLAAGETREVVLALETGTLEVLAYTVLLRGGESAASLDRGSLHVHAPLGAPSPHAPGEGEAVDTDHPTLAVNNASSAGSAARVYEFELFGDAALTQLLPGASGRSGDARADVVVGPGGPGRGHDLLVEVSGERRLLDEPLEHRRLIHRRRREPPSRRAGAGHPGSRLGRGLAPAGARRAERCRPRRRSAGVRHPSRHRPRHGRHRRLRHRCD